MLSGSGKSTIAWLIERFYEPRNGKILLDGVDIHMLDPRLQKKKKLYLLIILVG